MPNAVTPSTGPASTPLSNVLGNAGPGGKLGKDEFMRLLTAQLRYQDPMNPMDGHQLAADLAQFSGLEQLLNINEQLETQQSLSGVMLSAINNSVAMNTVGKTVVAASDQVLLAKDATGAVDGTIVVDIVQPGAATLELLNDTGDVVGRRALGYLVAGDQQSISVGSAAGTLPPGAYHCRITTTDANGVAKPQQTYFTGRVDGLSYSPDGAMLTSGSVEVSIGSIRRIIG